MSSFDEIKPEPFIPASQTLPEITIKGVILGIFLVLILGASSTYLGLKVGQTVAASIPAAVISMAVLRFFANSNILENNMVQTTASAAETISAGMLFTLPALLLLHFWTSFNYWECVAVALLGGILGVLFSVPIRRIMVNDPTLPFPEGTAAANVLKAGADTNVSVKELLYGGLGGGLIALFQNGFEIISDGFQSWFRVGNTVLGYGIGFAPAMFAVGYIIGIEVGLSLLVGLVLGWFIGIPIIGLLHGLPSSASTANNIAVSLWINQVRYIGLGIMIVGGFAAMFMLIRPIFHGISSSIKSIEQAKLNSHIPVIRTEHDLNIALVFRVFLLALIPLAAFLFYFTYHGGFSFPLSQHLILIGIGVLVISIAGFALASVCGYFAGLVGSSVSPISGLTLIGLLICAALVAFSMGISPHGSHSEAFRTLLAAFVIIVTGILSCAGAISNDTIQDLKAGQLVGATPWKQQVMMFVGVAALAFVIPEIFNLLFYAYGIAGITPHAGMDPTQTLQAPQAGMMATVVEGVFNRQLNSNMLGLGAIIAVIFLVINAFTRKIDYQFSILSIGLGMYLPLETLMPIIIGGCVSFLIKRQLKKRRSTAENPEEGKNIYRKAKQRGLLTACGMVAGSSLMGVILAIPFTIKGSADALRLVPMSFTPYADILGFVCLGLMCYWMFAVSSSEKIK